MTSAPAATAARIIASVFAGPKWVLLAWAITSGLALRNLLTGHAWVTDRDAVQDVTVTIIAAGRAARATKESLPMETTVSGHDVQHDSSDCRASRSDDLMRVHAPSSYEGLQQGTKGSIIRPEVRGR